MANLHAPKPVPTVAEDPLVADDADELDAHGEPVHEVDDGMADEDEPAQPAAGFDLLLRAEVDPGEARYERLHEDDEFADECVNELGRSPLVAADPAPSGKPQKRGQRESAMRAEDGDDSAATAPAEAAVQLPASVAPGTAKVGAKKPARVKKQDTVVPDEPMQDLVFFFFDIETTSNNKKQYDRIIELAMVAYDSVGVELGRWERRFSNCNALA